MFLNHFNFNAHPFAEHPPVHFILRDSRIQDVLDNLKFFLDYERLALITGQTGIGKSTLFRLFIRDLPQNRYNPVYIHLTAVNAKAFLRLFITELGEKPKIGKERLFLQIEDRIRKNDKCTLLMVDEAHLLDPETLTDLRVLTSSIDYELPLKVILCGQESINQTLKRSSHKDFSDRILVKCTFKPLSRDQTAAYMDNRITCAGGTNKIFDPESKKLIHDYTGGVPRLINNVSTACLIHAVSSDQKMITETLVNQTMNHFHLP